MLDNDGLVSVHLHYPLSEQFGQQHAFAISNPLEALRALDANHPGFRREFIKSPEYWIVVDGELKTYADFKDPEMRMPVQHEVHFVPKVSGNAFLGAALVGAVFPSIAGTTTATILGGLLMAGVFLGLSMLLAPKTAKEKDTEKDQNYAFSGPENVTGQGVAVPLLYGRCHCTSVVVSAALTLGYEIPPDPALGRVAQDAAMARSLSMESPPADLTPPPNGWPAIVQTSLTPPRVGPLNWEYMGNVGKMVIVNGKPEKWEVDYFRSPDRAYGWDRVDGFRLYNGRMLTW